MSVYTLGAVPAPRPLNLRRKPSAAPKTSSAVRAVTAIARPAGSSNTGLPGQLAPPRKELNLRKRPTSAPPSPALNKRRLPGSAPAPAPAPAGSGIASGGDYGRYDDGGGALETFVPSGGGGGGLVVPASDVRPEPAPAAEPSDGIPTWAAIAGIALCAVVGVVLFHRQGLV